jgi:hypothetical protein
VPPVGRSVLVTTYHDIEISWEIADRERNHDVPASALGLNRETVGPGTFATRNEPKQDPFTMP